MLMPNGPAAWVGLELGAKAGVHSVASACATGAEAIALGLDIIRAGRADVVVAGGTEAVIHPLPIAGFASMRAMSTRNDDPERASRPWDKGRDGFVLGEGAGAIVVWSAPTTPPPAAPGCTRASPAPASPPTRTTSCSRTPRVQGAIRAIAKAIARRRTWPKRDIVHVNAHATSTPVGDMLEIGALHKPPSATTRCWPRPSR